MKAAKKSIYEPKWIGGLVVLTVFLSFVGLALVKKPVVINFISDLVTKNTLHISPFHTYTLLRNKSYFRSRNLQAKSSYALDLDTIDQSNLRTTNQYNSASPKKKKLKAKVLSDIEISINAEEGSELRPESSPSHDSEDASNAKSKENRMQRQRRRRQCRQLRRIHQVIPGRSWGTMNKQQQDNWLELRCDDFFCEPHQLAGKGIYKCIPLPSDASQKEDTMSAHNEYLSDPQASHNSPT